MPYQRQDYCQQKHPSNALIYKAFNASNHALSQKTIIQDFRHLPPNINETLLQTPN